jgi:hypothetical protein
MLAPLWVIVGASEVTEVPYGTVTAMEWFDSVIVPVAEGEVKLNAVIALSERACVVSFSRLGHPDKSNPVVRIKAAKSLCFTRPPVNVSRSR